jgi:hypothetical protein
VFGTALSVLQLNAKANVAGTFTYTPISGTILPVGDAQTLNTSFVSTDVNYSAAAASVRINVIAAPAPAGVPQLGIRCSLARTGKSGNIAAYLTVTNTGTAAATNLTLTSIRLAGLVSSPVSVVIGNLPVGSTSTVELSFHKPGPGNISATLSVSAAYTGGQWQTSMPVTLP